MLWGRKETKKVIKQFGFEKGCQFLTFLFMYKYRWLDFDKRRRIIVQEEMATRVEKICKKYGSAYYRELHSFLNVALCNEKLCEEIRKEQRLLDQDVVVFFGQTPIDSDVAPACNKKDYVLITTEYDLNDNLIGQNVKIIASHDNFTYYASEPRGVLRCLAYYPQMPGSYDIEVELVCPLPRYATDPSGKLKYPFIVKGILSKDENCRFGPFSVGYKVEKAVYDAFWLDEEGCIQCNKESCYHVCNDECPLYLCEKADNLLAQNEFEDALCLIKRALKIAPYYCELWAKMGTVCEDIGNYYDAFDAYCEAIELNLKTQEIYFGIVRSLSLMGWIKNAEIYYDEYVRRWGDSVEINKLIQQQKQERQIATPREFISDAYYAQLFTEDFEAFWEMVVKEKEATFLISSWPQQKIGFRPRCNYLKNLVHTPQELLKMRPALIRAGISGATKLCLFDVYDLYDDLFIVY